MSVLFILLLFLFTPWCVYADDFNVSGGDTLGSSFGQTIVYGISELPTDIIYNSNSVVGVLSNDFLSNYSLDNFASGSSNYRNFVGSSGLSISAPPDTKIDVLYFYNNSAGHNVNVDMLAVPYSHMASAARWDNLEDIVNVVGGTTDSYVSILLGNTAVTRDGSFGFYSGVGNIADGVSGSLILDSMYVKNPISIEDISVVENVDVLDIVVTLKNISNSDIYNTLFKHSGYSQYVDYIRGLGGEFVVNYSLPYESGVYTDFGSIEISVTQAETRCVLNMGFYDDGGTMDYSDVGTISVFGRRLDAGWAGGTFVLNWRENLCVTRIPFTMYSDPVTYGVDPDSENLGSVADEVNDTVSDVLGVVIAKLDVLPKTAYKEY